MKTILITQARVGSTRLPNKVLLKIGDHSILSIHLARIKQAKRVDEVIVATTDETESDLICEIAENNGVTWNRGSLNDVLDRFYQTAKLFDPDWVVRVTSDCPLLDPELIDQVIEMAIEGDYDYCSNGLVQDFPDGQDVEVFKMSALTKAWQEAKKDSEREHVTPYIRNHSDFMGGVIFKAADLAAPAEYNAVRMTVDEPKDFEVVKWLINDLGADKSWLDYTKHLLENPDKLSNTYILRNEGYLKSINKER
ncbi:cytidylyltransferase domain-containing protein [Roseivirga pacifica]|uniref:cytidylyltransferase domain-containing protein n=1 Tax=Roseivirga pacifica TaxID=1267423 RepID=UPI003BB0C73C